MECCGGRGEAPACGVSLRRREQGPTADVARPPVRCVIMVATARQPTRDPVLVVSLRQVEGGVPVARRRRVPHSDGLPYAIPSASFNSLSTQGHA